MRVWSLAVACSRVPIALIAFGVLMRAGAATFVIVPVIGDHFTVLTAKTPISPTGQTAESQSVPLIDPLFDKAAFTAADSAIRKLQPDASTMMLLVADHAIYEGIASQSSANFVELLRPLGTQIANAPTTRLLLIVPDTSRISLPIQTGRGKKANLPDVRGIGFYADDVSYFFTTDSAVVHAPGMVRSFVSVMLVLVNPSMNVVEARTGGGFSQLLPVSGPDRVEHWASMTAERKVDALRQLIDVSLSGLVPKVISATTAR